MQEVLDTIKRLLPSFGFEQLDKVTYKRPPKYGLGEVYLTFEKEYLIFVTHNNSVHMTYDGIMFNIDLYKENPSQGLNERTLITQALEMLRK